MSMLLRASFVTALALPAILVLGSCRSPQSLCQEYFIERNDFEDRCGLPVIDPETQFCQEGHETVCGCGIVSAVEDPDEIVGACFEFFRTYECEGPRTLDYPMNLPSDCETRAHFKYLD